MAAFLTSLTPAQLKFLLAIMLQGWADGVDINGLRSGLSKPDPQTLDLVGYRKLLFSVLTTGLRGMDPESARKLVTQVGGALPAMAPKEVRGLLPDLMAFVAAGMHQSITPSTSQPLVLTGGPGDAALMLDISKRPHAYRLKGGYNVESMINAFDANVGNLTRVPSLTEVLSRQ